jgi:23S rRNA pseudouridine1911/1915/1917 synthase
LNTTTNKGFEYRLQLGKDAEGRSLITYLSEQFTHSTENEWKLRIASGLVFVNDLPATPETILRTGSSLIWRRPPWIEPEAPETFSVLHEDDDLIAVDKPAGLPTLPGANFMQSTLLYLVQQHCMSAAPVHRLGRWTSGIVLCAKNHDARVHIMEQWTNRTVEKHYRAMAEGSPLWDEQDITVPIGPVPHRLLGSVHAAMPKGKYALSHVKVRERRETSFICDVNISTGRPHQIRIHLASIGHPLVGDPLYIEGGIPSPDTNAVPGDPGYQLHAAQLAFYHPRTGIKMVISCPPPPLLQVTGEEW